MITLFKKNKFNDIKLIQHCNFGDGRPFSIFLLNNNILFINLHLGNKDVSMLLTTINNKDLNILQQCVKDINFTYLIIVGDFNRSLKEVTLNNITAKNISQNQKKPTCCHYINDRHKNRSNFNRYGHVDNILYSRFNSNEFHKIYDNFVGSDHMPVMGILDIN
jgi:endonuclease/exonuclease/phosphatase family metal-dependent hydrolase